MKLVTHLTQSIHGQAIVPGDKSISHRAALFAALANGDSQIENLQVSGVTKKMLQALKLLGVGWSLEGTTLTVNGRGMESWQAPVAALDCGNSATTLRLLAGASAAAGIPCILDGSPGLRQRPMQRILEPLQHMGVPIRGSGSGCAPLTLEPRSPGSRLKAIQYDLPVASAQVKSCLLLAGLAAQGSVILHEPERSRDHTERMLRQMGVKIESEPDHAGPGQTVTLHPPAAPLAPLQMHLPGDISSAAFLLLAAAILPGSEMTLSNVGLNPTRTGILEALQAMGADLRVQVKSSHANSLTGEPFGDITIRYARLKATEVSGDLVVRMIDEFPAFAVVAACAEGETRVKDAGELRHKESDRISCLCQELTKMGVLIKETPDGFIIQGPSRLSGAALDPHGDHRLAMALAVAGLAAEDAAIIEGAQIINESFPEFTNLMVNLGAEFTISE